MFSLDYAKTAEDLTLIKERLSDLATMWVDGYFLQKMREVYEERVFGKLEGSYGQEIGIQPTPMYETGQLWREFYISRDGIEMPAHGFWIEGLREGQDIWDVPLSALIDQLYNVEVSRDGPVFGPILDITDDEGDEFERQTLRFFYA